MKRSEAIQKALHSYSNTVCVNAEQVEVMLTIFEEMGMYPPDTIKEGHEVSEWDRE